MAFYCGTFYQHTALSSCAEDDRQIYSEGSVVGEASWTEPRDLAHLSPNFHRGRGKSVKVGPILHHSVLSRQQRWSVYVPPTSGEVGSTYPREMSGESSPIPPLKLDSDNVLYRQTTASDWLVLRVFSLLQSFMNENHAVRWRKHCCRERHTWIERHTCKRRSQILVPC